MSTLPSAFEGLSIITLGELAITRNGTAIEGLASRKAEALLVFLACNPGAHSREVLADMLWDDLTPDRARGNLSVLMTSLRQQLGDYFETTRHTLAFSQAQPHWLDALELQRTFEDARREVQPGARALTPATATQLDRALGLYRGDFLQGFMLRESAGFEQWVTTEQERLRHINVAARELLVTTYLRQQAYDAGLTHATNLLQQEPFHEEIHRQVLLLLAYSGRYRAAIAHYETYRRTLEAELGIAPADETEALYQRIRAGALQEQTATSATPKPVPEVLPITATHSAPLTQPKLPTPPTPFVGRSTEVAEITRMLGDSTCRLMTLLGPGGIGKTRLAIEAASVLRAAFRDASAFVPLAPLTRPEHIAEAIGQALGITFSEQSDPWPQVLRYLAPKHMLLVLDNFEHLLEAVDLIAELLDRAPNVRLLVTSRERVQLRAEWLFQVEGLLYPPAATHSPKHPQKASAVAHYTAVNLFVQQARQVAPQFQLDDDNAAAIVRICQLVEGMPLAIELAAAWVRVSSCEQIADSLAQNFDLLATTLRDVPARHRSMRAAFDHSWRLLAEQERQVLCRLSVFRGGFCSDAARVVGANESQLAALIDRSLLRRQHSGRYDLHELLRQFAAEHLMQQPEQAKDVQHSHAAYYLHLAAAQAEALEGRAPQNAVAMLQNDLDNIRQAWSYGVATRMIEAIGEASHGVIVLYTLLGLLAEALSMLDAVTKSIAAEAPTRARVELLVGHANVLNRRGMPAQAVEMARAALDLATGTGEAGYEALARYHWGEALIGLGNYQEACSQLEHVRQHAARTEARRLEANALRQIGLTWFYQGSYARAESCYAEALSRFQAIDDRRGEAFVLNNLGVAAEEQGAYAAARARYEGALHIQREIGNRHGAGYVLLNLGVIASGQGRYSEADQLYREGLEICEAAGDRLSEGIALLNLGDVALFQGDYAAARQRYEQSLHIRHEIHDRLGEGYVLVSFARLWYYLGDLHTAVETAREALAITREVQARSLEASALNQLGYILAALDQTAEAAGAHQQSLSIRRELGEHHRAVDSMAGLAYAFLASGDHTQAYQIVEAILAYAQDHQMDGVEEPGRVYLACIKVLEAITDARFEGVLQQAHQHLQARATAILEPAQRRSFLANVATHHAIIQYWRLHLPQRAKA